MVDKFEWNPNTICKNWMNICQGFSGIPFMAQTLWQVGPLPRMLNGGNWSGLWGQTDYCNQNWGQVSDTYHPSPSKPDDTDGMTPEEKLAAREKKAAERAEKQKLVDNYGKMYSLLEEYGKTLSETTEPKKSVYESVLNDYKSKITINTKTETINEKFADLKVLYNKYSDKIKEMKLDAAKKDAISAKDTEYKITVTSLRKEIDKNDLKTTFGVLNNEDGLEWNDDVDIMELLSTWNSNESTKSNHIMKLLNLKRSQETATDRTSQLDELADIMNNKLLEVARNIDENKLTEETKTLLEDAITTLKAFTSGNRLRKGDYYSNAFDNLYRAIRLAKAEIAEKELKESFEFLGDENPYKTSTIVADTKAGIKSEGLEDKRVVEKPTGKSITELAEEKGYRETKYKDVYYYDTKNEKKHYYFDEQSNSFKELFGVKIIGNGGKCWCDFIGLEVKEGITYEDAIAFSKQAENLQLLKTNKQNVFQSKKNKKNYSFNTTTKRFEKVSNSDFNWNDYWNRTSLYGQ